MTYHVLNGDALAARLPSDIDGTVVVCRECLIEGPLEGTTIDDLLQTRSAYLSSAYTRPQDFYKEQVAAGFEVLRAIEEGSGVVLWFEHDLFCQVNMWFCIHLLCQLPHAVTVWRVYPAVSDDRHFWKGFGAMSAEQLTVASQNRQKLPADDLALGNALWLAYKKGKVGELLQLAENETASFPMLREVARAHAERFASNGAPGRPERTLLQIQAENPGIGFGSLFGKFNEREGIYGFGDLQVKKIVESLLPPTA